MTIITLNSILGFVDGQSCALLWDLRDPPNTAAQPVSTIHRHRSPITKFQLPHSQLATTPPVTALRITCDIFPYKWRIEARNQQGVTVRDVLTAIYNVAHAPLRVDEWEGLSAKQQDRIKKVWDVRWRGSTYPDRERREGVRRVDCLLHYTRFAGITMALDHDFECILTLSRNLKW